MVGGPANDTAGGTHARQALAAMTVVAVALGVAVAGTAVVGAQGDGPVVGVADATVDPGETTTVAITLDSAPNGVSGYSVNVSVADTSVTTVTNVSIGEQFDSLGGSSGVTEDGSTAYLSAADLSENVQSGASEVTLATVTVQGESAGSTALEPTVESMDNDDGSSVDPAVEAGTVTVGDTGESGDATEASDTATGGDGGTSSGFGPGFRLVVALFALVTVGLLARYRS